MITIRPLASRAEHAAVSVWQPNVSVDDWIILVKDTVIAVADEYLTVTLAPVAIEGSGKVRVLHQREDIETAMIHLMDIYAKVGK